MTTIRQLIVSDIHVKGLLSSLDVTPDAIKSVRDRIATMEFELSTFKGVENAKEAIAMIEAEIDFEVMNETEDVEVNGKKDELPTIKTVKKYTNADQRAAASLALKSKSQAYINAKNDLIAAEREKAELILNLQKSKNQLDYHTNVFSSLKAAADVIASLCHESVGAAKTESISKVSALLGSVADEIRATANKIGEHDGD